MDVFVNREGSTFTTLLTHPGSTSERSHLPRRMGADLFVRTVTRDSDWGRGGGPTSGDTLWLVRGLQSPFLFRRNRPPRYLPRQVRDWDTTPLSLVTPVTGRRGGQGSEVSERNDLFRFSNPHPSSTYPSLPFTVMTNEDSRKRTEYPTQIIELDNSFSFQLKTLQKTLVVS